MADLPTASGPMTKPTVEGGNGVGGGGFMCHQTLIFTAALMIASTRGRRAHVPNTTQYVLIQAPRLIYNSEKCITLLLKKPIYLADLWTMCQVYQYHSTGSTMLIPSTFCKICQNPPHSLADTNTGYALWKRKKKNSLCLSDQGTQNQSVELVSCQSGVQYQGDATFSSIKSPLGM